MAEGSGPPLATLALALTVQEWRDLGMGDTSDPLVAPTKDLATLVERVTALLLVRCVAVATPLGHYPDLSTSNICRTTLMKKESNWPSAISETVISQLRQYVERILKGYKDVPYHNAEHGFHVILSINKLVDMIVGQSSTGSKKKTPPPSFGFRNDALAQLACVFAALIHDVEHQGIPNRQLAQEDDRLAVLYNDQSIAENWSIYIGFSELLQDEFKDLRQVLFPDKEDYRRFRKMVINLVLTTDIASPERTQLVKSKWKEAFGDPIETIERKMEARRMSLTGQNVQFRPNGERMDRRGTASSGMSDVSFEPSNRGQESPSITPEPSAHDGDDDPDNSNNNKIAMPLELAAASPQHQKMMRRSSAGERRASMASRRSSAGSRRSSATSKYRQRLGILRTVDLSGETLENYSRSPSMDHSRRHSAGTSSDAVNFNIDQEEDQPDDLKMTVLMETLIQYVLVHYLLAHAFFFDHAFSQLWLCIVLFLSFFPFLCNPLHSDRPMWRTTCRAGNTWSSSPIVCTSNCAEHTQRNAAAIPNPNGLRTKLAFSSRTCCPWRIASKIRGSLA